jgi:uncharacterized membrane protein
VYYLGLFFSIVGILGLIYAIRLKNKEGDLYKSRLFFSVFFCFCIVGVMFVMIESLPAFVRSIVTSVKSVR